MNCAASAALVWKTQNTLCYLAPGRPTSANKFSTRPIRHPSWFPISCCHLKELWKSGSSFSGSRRSFTITRSYGQGNPRIRQMLEMHPRIGGGVAAMYHTGKDERAASGEVRFRLERPSFYMMWRIAPLTVFIDFFFNQQIRRLSEEILIVL